MNVWCYNRGPSNAVTGFWDFCPYVVICMNVFCCYNFCLGNAVKEFLSLVSSGCMLVGW
jgi:hypothetical protein